MKPAPTAIKPAAELTAQQARSMIVRAQGLGGTGAPDTPGDVLRRLGAVQLDTISVLARSHELVAYARLGACPRSEIESAYWAKPARAFEYWAHAACVLPIDYWPYFAFRRRANQRRSPDTAAPAFTEVRAHLRESPVTVSEAGGARDGAAGWWSWSAAKRAMEVLYRNGEVVVTARAGWKRVYDLPERAIPSRLLRRAPDDAECYRFLVREAARALGVASARDIANYFMLATSYAGVPATARALLAEAIAGAGLLPVRVERWEQPAYVDPAALEAAAESQPGRAVLLSPFDSLIWASGNAGSMATGREYVRRLFDFIYMFEAYRRPAEREHGYFTMPLLARDNLIGRVDPARVGKTLVARYASLEQMSDEDVDDMATALRDAAAWVGCDDVAIERTQPSALKRELQRRLRKA